MVRPRGRWGGRRGDASRVAPRVTFPSAPEFSQAICAPFAALLAAAARPDASAPQSTPADAGPKGRPSIHLSHVTSSLCSTTLDILARGYVLLL